MQASFGAAHFETDKTFPLPGALPTFRAVAARIASEPQRQLLVIGHTDTVGTPSHNLALSEERASSIAAYLKDDADGWMKFYEGSVDSKKWGLREDQLMLHALPFGGTPYYGREPGGASNADFTKAVRDFQRAKGQPETGTMDSKTRKLLVQEYMAAEGSSVPQGTSMQTLGCGQRHRVEQVTGPSDANRRVDVLAFEKAPVKPSPDECKSGKHPGCKVYDQWIAEVTEKIQ